MKPWWVVEGEAPKFFLLLDDFVDLLLEFFVFLRALQVALEHPFILIHYVDQIVELAHRVFSVPKRSSLFGKDVTGQACGDPFIS